MTSCGVTDWFGTKKNQIDGTSLLEEEGNHAQLWFQAKADRWAWSSKSATIIWIEEWKAWSSHKNSKLQVLNYTLIELFMYHTDSTKDCSFEYHMYFNIYKFVFDLVLSKESEATYAWRLRF